MNATTNIDVQFLTGVAGHVTIANNDGRVIAAFFKRCTKNNEVENTRIYFSQVVSLEYAFAIVRKMHVASIAELCANDLQLAYDKMGDPTIYAHSVYDPAS